MKIEINEGVIIAVAIVAGVVFVINFIKYQKRKER